jgi:hypothetical protein
MSSPEKQSTATSGFFSRWDVYPGKRKYKLIEQKANRLMRFYMIRLSVEEQFKFISGYLSKVTTDSYLNELINSYIEYRHQRKPYKYFLRRLEAVRTYFEQELEQEQISEYAKKAKSQDVYNTDKRKALAYIIRSLACIDLLTALQDMEPERIKTNSFFSTQTFPELYAYSLERVKQKNLSMV